MGILLVYDVTDESSFNSIQSVASLFSLCSWLVVENKYLLVSGCPYVHVASVRNEGT